MRDKARDLHHSAGPMIRMALRVLGSAAIAGLLNACVAIAPDQPRVEPSTPDWNEYSVKVVCGTIPAPSPNLSLNVGRYFTSVNVHNPSLRRNAELWYKAVVSEKPPKGGKPSAFKKAELMPDYALEIDCEAVRELVSASSAFVEGWVVILTRSDLDVSPVYTAGSTATIYPVQSIDVETVRPLKVHSPGNLLGDDLKAQAHCPGGEGCCCNISNRTTGAVWPDCSAGLECRGWRPGPTPPSGPVATCTPIGRNPAFASPLFSSQPPFCGNP